MMRIDEIEQEDSDIDWFAVDANGYIIHFASGGGRLPESVASSEENLLELHQYFLALAENVAGSVRIEQNTDGSGTYRGAIRHAQRGLFSFYKTSLRDLSDTHYYLVARPIQPLTIQDIPAPLVALLSRTQLPSPVLDKTHIDSTIIV